MKTILKPCLQCKKEFEAPLSEVKRGNGKFCSHSCAGTYTASKKPKKKPNVQCAHCGTEFYKNESKKKNSKSGLFFCSRACKDAAQRIGGVKEIMPSHYGTGACSYRSICFAHHEKVCVVCGEDKIVAVHHYDHKHHNDDPKNLVPLCPTHHQYVHSNYKHLVEKQIEEYLNNKWGVRP